MTARLLILGGTTEASRLAWLLDGRPGLEVITSLAGRTSSPATLPGRVRIGGFGGTGFGDTGFDGAGFDGTVGLAAYLRAEQIGAVVDATHPFAAVMRWHAHDACLTVGVPRLRVERPGWAPGPGDRWTVVPSLTAAADAIASGPARRVFLTTGRTELDAFAPAADGRRWWLIRCIDPPGSLRLVPADVVLGRGPFTLEGEIELMRRHHVDLLVTKNSGGDATGAKLEAARLLGVGVVMVERPPSPPGPTAATAGEAAGWALSALGRRPL